MRHNKYIPLAQGSLLQREKGKTRKQEIFLEVSALLVLSL